MSGLFDAPDWTALGLVLAIVGCFLLANGILFRNPKAMLEQRFGRRPTRLSSIREVLFHRVQMGLGFAFLIAGFTLQLLGRARPGPEAAGGSTALWVGIVVVLVIVLEVAGWWWSLFAIRRTVRRWLVQHPEDLEREPHLAREVGELFGVASHGDDTVPSYVARLRRALQLEGGRRAAAVRDEKK